MKTKAIIIQNLLIIIFITTTNLTTIQKAPNGVLFKSIGQLIPELSWATIRLKLNITEMFTETEELCRASYLMKREYNKIERKYGEAKVPLNKIRNIRAHLLVSLTYDVDTMCEENLQRMEEIIQTFNLRRIKIPFYSSQMKPETANINELTMVDRIKRQIITGVVLAVGAVTSLISLFTSYELINMSTAPDSEEGLIDNNNNIITSLQAHETTIRRGEKTISQIKKHLENLEKHLSIERNTETTYLNLFAVKLFGASTTRHLQRTQDGLYQLLKNKLSPQLITLRKIQKAMGKVKKIANAKGYKLATKTDADIFMVDTNFVAYENGTLIILCHIPLYKQLHLMKLLEYQETPMIINTSLTQQVAIKPAKPILAINNDLTLYKTYNREEIEHDCKKLRDKTYCRNKNIVKIVANKNKDCTLALYTKDKADVINQCPIKLSYPHEIILQLNSTTFYVYTPNKTPVHVTCHNQEDKNKIEIAGPHFITLNTECKAIVNQHVFHSGIRIETETAIKKDHLNLKLEDLIEEENFVEKDFVEILKEEQQIAKGPLKIRDVKQKYHLRIL